MDILKFNNYEGSAELDMTRGICRGKILFIDDVVTYEAATPADLQKEFESSITDYIETCAELGRVPQMPLRGQFNVRISPALHKAAVLRALTDNTSLNDVVVRALDAYVNAGASTQVNRHVTVGLMPADTVGPATVSAAIVNPATKPRKKKAA